MTFPGQGARPRPSGYLRVRCELIEKPPRLTPAALFLSAGFLLATHSERFEGRLIDRGGGVKTVIVLIGGEGFARQRAE